MQENGWGMLREKKNKVEWNSEWREFVGFLFWFGVFFASFLHTCAVSNFILCQLSVKHVGKSFFLLENNKLFALSPLQEVYGMMPRVSVDFWGGWSGNCNRFGMYKEKFCHNCSSFPWWNSLMTWNGRSKIILSMFPWFPECLAPHHRSKQAAQSKLIQILAWKKCT